MIEELAAAIKKKKAILFAGSGVSKNLGLPDYSEMIHQIAENFGYNPDEFTAWGNNDFLTLAEYYCLEKGSLGELRSWMDRKWHNPKIELEHSEIHRMLIELNFPLIYTTNFDRWLEEAHDFYGKPYTKITNVADITQIEEGKTQIVKFHGDFDDDSSIVLTESSFFKRLDFETSLDIKLRSDSLEKSLLFIGYSLSDINIRYMLYKLHNQWKISKYEHLRPKSYILLNERNPIKETILKERGITPIIYENENPGKSLHAFLTDLLKLAREEA
ncbi:SIR2 family protein [Domibacillus sp. DTU_2020_1001157_1_SI_ALB_TIR_016]|uniref:SIR2 family protein n=1 Tax=Domibacillus sp. DTU_2020_1001157_1_SI_ALB_TIR_016 TaxID=3077789 RepID=UPI0028F12EBE|nr:SIR2 family protein [Domibacillus sp. DTU_2020_1001157_1_SI_ALB_TIR_016]WNS78152.1 SIR2 family protein [Domibacillus sp. DTU_2020_1001157_1_SI_ALB_TIR_016]